MRCAAIDSGSRWLGLAIADDGPPTHPLRYICGKAISVGREVARKVPTLVTPKPRTAPDGTVTTPAPYYLTTTREVTEEDECAVAAEVMSYLIEHEVALVTIEKVASVYARKGTTVKGVAAQGTELGRTGRVYTRIAERCMARGIEVRYVLASTWRARLFPLVRAEAELSARATGEAPPEGATIKRRGDGLVPVLRAGVYGWPAGGTFPADEIEHVCDAAGILLSAALPVTESKRKARSEQPRRRATGPRAPKGKLDRAKARERRSARYEAARVAAGCTCGLHRGRHRKTCPLHVSRATQLVTRVAAPTSDVRAAKREARAAAAAEKARLRARRERHRLLLGDP